MTPTASRKTILVSDEDNQVEQMVKKRNSITVMDNNVDTVMQMDFTVPPYCTGFHTPQPRAVN